MTPRHFGVSHYLLLNEESPILEIAQNHDELMESNDTLNKNKIAELFEF